MAKLRHLALTPSSANQPMNQLLTLLREAVGGGPGGPGIAAVAVFFTNTETVEDDFDDFADTETTTFRHGIIEPAVSYEDNEEYEDYVVMTPNMAWAK